MTANLWRLVNKNGGNASIKLIAGRKLLGNLPEKVRDLALSSLAGRGIAVIEGNRVNRGGRKPNSNGRRVISSL